MCAVCCFNGLIKTILKQDDGSAMEMVILRDYFGVLAPVYHRFGSP